MTQDQFRNVMLELYKLHVLCDKYAIPYPALKIDAEVLCDLTQSYKMAEGLYCDPPPLARIYGFPVVIVEESSDGRSAA